MKLIEMGDSRCVKIIKAVNEIIECGYGYTKINIKDYAMLDIEKNTRERGELEGRTQSKGSADGLLDR